MTVKSVCKIRSSIKPPLKRAVLFRGTVLGGMGGLLLLMGGVFIPLSLLKIFGLPLLIVAIFLITKGLLPYRRLCQMETKPNEIVLLGDDHLKFSMLGKHILTVPKSSIDEVKYIEKDNDYGIALWLKQTAPEKIVIHRQTFEIGKYQQESQKNHGCDLFFPFFNRHAYNTLREVWPREIGTL